MCARATSSPSRVEALRKEIAEAESVASRITHAETSLAQQCYVDGLRRALAIITGSES